MPVKGEVSFDTVGYLNGIFLLVVAKCTGQEPDRRLLVFIKSIKIGDYFSRTTTKYYVRRKIKLVKFVIVLENTGETRG